ncbi:NitT/TauT family transport system permease protein/sulfonate transport system permease protein [Gemmobacter megaterium]|uniref:NitT/TauT family transport system permease protein/sulfonate transport system permease protein n=1 Tax=Gemmobacter megaterium TaxID=1086013 RepID=A0A1N7Q674_9RHOB|nr:ABC transporter permease subunit [Gemmobacter megaterium]GGE23417.1 ABC transporter permease [Gemmobacter megaterium]SIT18343.1 NitT/TauT family transport system permease protein/sulfonate transport system permease protein [Gemmobacter megaterium]
MTTTADHIVRAQTDRARKRARSRQVWVANLIALAFLAAWWVYSLSVPAYQMPGPQLVAVRMVDLVLDANERVQLLWSLVHVLSAIGISFVIGFALALMSNTLWPLRGFIDDRLTPFLNAFSGIGWLFMAMMWFGVTSFTVIFAVTLILIPFAIINIRTGLDELDQEIGELGRSLTRNPLRIFFRITVPMLVPYLFATLRTAFGVSWKVVLTAELFGGNAGVGYLLNSARQEFDTETIFAVICFIILFVYLSEVLVFSPIQRNLKRRFARE